MVITGDAKLISTAYVKARSQMEATVQEDGAGQYGKYATLASITKATTAIFGTNGLAIIQEGEVHDGGVTIATWLLHDTGATIEFSPLTIPLAARTAHAIGSAMTYARRYQLLAVCGLAPDDDDGQAAQDSTQNAPKSSPKARTPLASEKAPANPFEQTEPTPALATREQVATLNKLGLEFYGKAEWDEQLPKIVEAVSTGAALKAEELKPREAEKLIEGIKKRMAQVAQMKAAA